MVNRPVREGDLGHGPVGLEAALFLQRAQAHELRARDSEVGVDGIVLVHHGQKAAVLRTGGDEVADRTVFAAGEPGDRSGHIGVAEFDFRFAHGGLGGIEVGLGAVVSSLSVVAVLLADGVFLVQRENTVQVLAGLRELGLRLFHDAVGLTERRPVGIRLDLEQQLPLLDILPFVISAAHEDTRNLGPYFDGTGTFRLPRIGETDRDVALLDGHNAHERRGKRGRPALLL